MNVDCSKIRVLIVEDHPSQRFAILHMLKRCGVGQVFFAGNGCDAADLLQRHEIDLVLCDIEMQGGNGPELMAAIASTGLSAFCGRAPMWVWMSALAVDIVDSHVALAKWLHFPKVTSVIKPVTTDKLLQLLSECSQLANSTPHNTEYVLSDDDICAALDMGDAFTFFLQPQIELSTGRICGAEVLCRWHHQVAGIVPPGYFVPRLEQRGKAGILFARSLQQCIGLLRAEFDEDFTLSFNASANTLCEADSVQLLDSIVSNAGVGRSRIVVELTEDVNIPSVLDLSISLNRLRVLGYGLAIDDFGIGIATLKLLADLPFTEMKIDRIFVRELLTGNQRARICENTIRLANDLQLRCVAEGVETREQRDRLIELGCQVAQGYYWSPAVSITEFREMLSSWTPRK